MRPNPKNTSTRSREFEQRWLADGNAYEELAAGVSGAAGRVAVGAMVVATPVLLLQAVDRFKARSPKASLAIEEGDLSRLLPRLRSGELDFIVGRLEPGYVAPDLQAEPLFAEAMCLVAARGNRLARAIRPTWKDLASEPWVMPPLWASSRVKLNQAFYRRGLEPPADTIETSSYLMTITFLRRRKAIGLVARGMGEQLQRENIAKVLPVTLRLELPPVGILTLRARRHTPAAEQFLACVRETARKPGGKLAVKP